MGRHHKREWLSWFLWVFTLLNLLLWCGDVLGTKANTRHRHRSASEGPEASLLNDIKWDFLKPSQACPSAYAHDNQFLLLVSNLDGSLSAIDMRTSGELLWSLKVDQRPLLSSSVSNIPVTRNGESFQLIPGLNGELYLSDGQSVSKFELTAESLLSSSIRITDNAVFVGGKEIGSYGVDAATGQMVYSCTAAGCKDSSEAKSSSGNMLVISHTVRTVRAVDVSSGVEKWNFSVGQHELVYTASSDNVKSGIEQDTSSNEEDIPSPNCTPKDVYDYHMRLQEENLAKQLIRVAMASGNIVGMKADDAVEMAWSRQFESPVVKVWFLHQGKVEAVNLFDGRLNPGLTISSESAPQHNYASVNPTLFVGRHKHQMYVQEHSLDQNTCQSEMPWIVKKDKENAKQPADIKWKPYKNMVHTPLLQGNRGPQVPLLGQFQDSKDTDLSPDTGLAVWTEHYPFDDGYYLYEYTEHHTNHIQHDESAAEEIFIVVASLSVWWKEVLSIGLIMAVCFQMLVVKLSPQPKVEESTGSAESRDSLSSSDCNLQLQTLSSTAEFKSRFADEYECIKCLGKGGYGIVYQAKYKMDEQEYAIKRIAVPNSDATVKKKILREVRTLAVLDHVGIVRYFHSWMEEPPLGWQEERDKQLVANTKGSGDWRSPTPTTEMSVASVDNVPTSLSSNLPPQQVGRASQIKKQPSLLSEIMPLGESCFQFDDTTSKTSSARAYNSGSGEFSPHSTAEWTNDESGSFSLSGNAELMRGVEDRRDSFSIVFQASETESVGNNNLINRNLSVPFKKYTESAGLQGNSCFSHSTDNSNSVVFQEDSHTGILGDSLESRQQPNCRSEQSDSSSSVVFENSKNARFLSGHGDLSKVLSDTNHNDLVNECDSGKDPSGRQSIHFSLSSHRSCEYTNTDEADDPEECMNIINEEHKNLTPAGDEKVKKKMDKAAVPKLFLYIQMQLCRLETLKDWLLAHTLDRNSSVCLDIFWQIVSAVDYVHSKGLIHRDLKPSNIFFALDGTVKVGDFGLVTAAENQPELDQTVDRKDSCTKHTADVGTQLYMSPEQIEKKPYDQKVDIFSLGLILLELLVPFTTGMERVATLQAARKGSLPEDFCHNKLEAGDLVSQLLSVRPKKRPTTQQIQQHSLLLATASQRTLRFRTISGSSSDPFLQKETDE